MGCLGEGTSGSTGERRRKRRRSQQAWQGGRSAGDGLGEAPHGGIATLLAARTAERMVSILQYGVTPVRASVTLVAAAGASAASDPS